ncbi:MAG: hypothetical protein AAB427_14275, partial [Chloroflexota bacterium]
LTINPANMTAQANLKWLKQAAPAETADSRTSTDKAGSGRDQKSATPFAPQSPVENISAIDDPYQCIFCGAPAKKEDRRCPECKRNLITKRARSKSLSYALRTAIFAVGIQFGVAVIEGLVDGTIASEGRNGFIRYVFSTLKLFQFFGDYLSWPAQWVPILLAAASLRVLIFMLVIAGLTARMSLAYYGSIAVMAADIAWSLFRWIRNFLGPFAAVLYIIADIAALALIFAADRDFEVNDERILSMPDRRIKGGVELNRRGHNYSREGKWALAVAHWRAAIAALPNRPEFYKDLAIGYAQIKYYDRALGALAEAGRQAPVDADIPKMKEIIEGKKAADPRARG